MDKQIIVALQEALQSFLDQHSLGKDACPCGCCVKALDALHGAWLQDHK